MGLYLLLSQSSTSVNHQSDAAAPPVDPSSSATQAPLSHLVGAVSTDIEPFLLLRGYLTVLHLLCPLPCPPRSFPPLSLGLSLLLNRLSPSRHRDHLRVRSSIKSFPRRSRLTIFVWRDCRSLLPPTSESPKQKFKSRRSEGGAKEEVLTIGFHRHFSATYYVLAYLNARHEL